MVSVMPEKDIVKAYEDGLQTVIALIQNLTQKSPP